MRIYIEIDGINSDTFLFNLVNDCYDVGYEDIYVNDKNGILSDYDLGVDINNTEQQVDADLKLFIYSNNIFINIEDFDDFKRKSISRCELENS